MGQIGRKKCRKMFGSGTPQLPSASSMKNSFGETLWGSRSAMAQQDKDTGQSRQHGRGGVQNRIKKEDPVISECFFFFLMECVSLK